MHVTLYTELEYETKKTSDKVSSKWIFSYNWLDYSLSRLFWSIFQVENLDSYSSVDSTFTRVAQLIIQQAE